MTLHQVPKFVFPCPIFLRLKFHFEHIHSNSFRSPSGKLVQIEYALNAVAAGSPSVGIKAQNGVVLATEKKQRSILYDESSIHKVEPITRNIGMIYSGMGPDYRLISLLLMWKQEVSFYSYLVHFTALFCIQRFLD